MNQIVTFLLLCALCCCTKARHHAIASAERNEEWDELTQFMGSGRMQGANGSVITSDNQKSASDFFSALTTLGGVWGVAHYQGLKEKTAQFVSAQGTEQAKIGAQLKLGIATLSEKTGLSKEAINAHLFTPEATKFVQPGL